MSRQAASLSLVPSFNSVSFPSAFEVRTSVYWSRSKQMKMEKCIAIGMETTPKPVQPLYFYFMFSI